MLKYKREGLAYKIWRMGSMNRAAFGAKTYPVKMEEAMSELFEKKTEGSYARMVEGGLWKESKSIRKKTYWLKYRL